MTFNEMLEAAQANIGKKFRRSAYTFAHVYFDGNGELVCWYSQIKKLEKYIINQTDFQAVDWVPCDEPKQVPKDSRLSFAEVIEIWRKDWSVKVRRKSWVGEVWKNGVEFCDGSAESSLCMCDAPELQPHISLHDYLANDWEIIK